MVHLGGYVRRFVVEGQHRRNDHAAGLVRRQQVFQVDAAQRRFPGNQHHLPPLFQADVRCADQEVIRAAVGDGRQRFHAAWGDDHTLGSERAAGNRRRHIFRRVGEIRQSPDLRRLDAALQLEI